MYNGLKSSLNCFACIGTHFFIFFYFLLSPTGSVVVIKQVVIVMAKQIDYVEQPDTDSSEDFISDSNHNTSNEQGCEEITYSNTCVLADFRLACLQEFGVILPSVVQNYQQVCKDLDKNVVPHRSINPCFSADFTPWWEVFTKSDHKRAVTTSATEPKAGIYLQPFDIPFVYLCLFIMFFISETWLK